VAGQIDRVGDDHVVPDDTVVGHVSVRHDQRVAADAGRVVVLPRRRPINRRELTDGRAVAYDQVRGLAVVFQVLRVGAHDGRVTQYAVFTDRRVLLHQHHPGHDGPATYLDIGTDDGEGTYPDVLSDPRALVYDGSLVYSSHEALGSLSTTCDHRSPSATSSPLTYADACILHVAPRSLRSSSSKRTESPGRTGRLNLALSMPMK